MTFKESFNLIVDSKDLNVVSLPGGSRSTIVIVQDGSQLRPLEVRVQTRRDCSQSETTRLFYSLQIWFSNIVFVSSV